MNYRTLLTLFFTYLFSTTAFSDVDIKEIGYEASGIKVEYYESSNSGIVIPIDCPNCDAKQYTFSGKPTIKKSGGYIRFSDFMNEYWNVEYPTIFLNLESKKVTRIVY